MSVRDELISLSAERCLLDSNLFMWYKNGKLEGLVSIYVDDFIWTGSTEFEICVIEKLRNKFLIGSSASRDFRYVGLNMVSTKEGMTVDQFQYASSLQPICISRGSSANKNSELSESEKTDYRGLLGQLNWLSTRIIRKVMCTSSCHSPKMDYNSGSGTVVQFFIWK